ncbi:MAG: hypothetical protein H6Q17_2185 [Bacteroidetes bacterium]|nr:hypothetical protein [Bacteroidota bacterium]
MLNRGKVLMLILIILLGSCHDSNENQYKKLFQLKEYQISMQVNSKETYFKIYHSIVDSISSWKKNGLYSWHNFEINTNSKIDSLLCFNKIGDKLVTSTLERNKDNVIDGLTFLYGVKIREKWFFFEGAHIVLPRKNYTKDIHTPLPFAKLHEIAMKEVFSGYLIEKKIKKDMGWWKNIFAPEYNYSYEINDKWFDDHFKTSWGYYKNDKFITPSTQREWDSLYIDKALSVWRK